MPARVNIEAKAFGDHRFTRLGRMLLASLMGGHVATQEALPTVDQFRHPRMQWRVGIGAMAEVWAHCTEENIDVVPEDDLADIVGHPHAGQLLERCKLGEIVDGGVRIRGAAGRVEWLAKKRKAAKKGGEARRKKASTRGGAKPGAKPSAKPDGSRQGEHNGRPMSTHMGTPPTPTLTPTPTNTDRDLARARVLDALWSLQEDLRADLDLPALNHPPGWDIRVLGALNAGFTQEQLEHVLRVYHADGKRDPRKRRFFDGTLNWQAERIQQALGRPIEPAEPEAKDPATGSAPPASRDEFGDGEVDIPRSLP